MPLYEIVLRFADRDEIRLTDGEGYRSGDEIVIAGRRFVVTGREPPRAVRADGRFVAVPCDELRASSGSAAVGGRSG